MKLEDYFEFISAHEIGVQGTRVGIEVILNDYFSGSLPETIAAAYPSLTLEQVHATITYYLHNQTEIDGYFQRWVTRGESAIRQQAGLPLVKKLLRAQSRARRS
ncbi:MAG: DUF433 domain-containing protein [Planctomycetota bacterium]|nr:DUF433 domain-containing protein [Planctomycetota bacterium]